MAALDEPGVYELCFDRAGESINKPDDRTVAELREAALRGVLVTSAKDAFIVGTDITEFGAKFSKTAADVSASTA